MRARDEHSSGRIEVLQLCAQENLQIVNCTTPANCYCFRRRYTERWL